MVRPHFIIKGVAKVIEAKVREATPVEVSLFMELSVGSGILVIARMVMTVSAGMPARPVLRQVSWVRTIRRQVMTARVPNLSREFSQSEDLALSVYNGGPCNSGWVAQDFISAHNSVLNQERIILWVERSQSQQQLDSIGSGKH